jgi:3-methyladenine DNA glycosylase AlkD
MNKAKIKKIEETVKSLYSSLESHFRYTYIKTTEGKAFHIKCVKDYANDIKNLCDLL